MSISRVDVLSTDTRVLGCHIPFLVLGSSGPWGSLFVSSSSRFGWSFVERLSTVGSCCSDFRVIRSCLAAIPPLCYSLDLPYTCPTMRTSSGPTRSSGLRIGGNSAEEPDLGQTDEGFV